MGKFQFYGPDNTELPSKTEPSLGGIFVAGAEHPSITETLLASFFGATPSRPAPKEVEFTFYSAAEPTSLTVTLFQSSTAVTIPFVFENVPLPQP